MLAVVLLLAGCAAAPDHRPAADAADAADAAAAAAAFPDAFYREPRVAGRVFLLDPARSQLQVLVFRAGPMARRGHNHLVRAGTLRGAVFLADTVGESRMDLQVPVAGLEVDPEADRRAAGAAFAAAVDEQAREGTRANMLGPRVLDAARFPLVTVSGRVVGGELPWLVLELELVLRGHVHRMHVPVQVELDGHGLRARGLLSLRHADLALQPFAALGGLLAVDDPLLLRFDLFAHR